jgi:hypothetical protein
VSPGRAILVGLALAAASCGQPEIEPLKLDGNALTVDNRTKQAWTSVDIWLNHYYRVQAREIPAGGRFQAPLDAFVEGYGRRFDFHAAQVRDLRLTAKLPDGSPIEIKKAFEAGGLAGSLGRAVGGGKR